MKIIKNDKPDLIKTDFKCDKPLSRHLNDKIIYKHMNKSFCCALVSKPGGGKTTHLTSLLQTKSFYKKVFYHIYLFMPKSSLDSMKDNIFDEIDDSQKFSNGVTFDDLNYVYEQLLENTKNNENSLIVFDDVQSSFSDKEISMNLLHIINNRRHYKCS